ncbi:unannotated protein [freshwater metagenome]|uniref:Unannotated protein n=1 Tax=freshwater metagenome TaxID=449393 RepID=A0A6J7UHG5_9ZZZZ
MGSGASPEAELSGVSAATGFPFAISPVKAGLEASCVLHPNATRAVTTNSKGKRRRAFTAFLYLGHS